MVAPSDPWQAHALDPAAPCAWRTLLICGSTRARRECPRATSSSAKRAQVRDGCDAVIFATGGILSEALAAAEILAARRDRGPRCGRPHDQAARRRWRLLEAARECGHVVTLEEHIVTGGIGQRRRRDLRRRADLGSRASTASGSAMFSPMWSATSPICARDYGLDAASVASVIRQAIAR